MRNVNSDPLQSGLESFLRDGDRGTLLEIVHRNGLRKPAGVDYPDVHRICDVCLDGVGYRVSRVADETDRSVRPYIYLTDRPDYDRPGVPLGLQGEALWRWIEDERRQPTEGDTRWSMYDSALKDEA